ncbi:hypothetical protein Vi05172_g11417 [Venturia inaequalis]|nr:hypothetical protein Vi05172_g11417 [Venturia inaequalis]
MDDVVRVDEEKGTGKLLAPSKSLFETDVVFKSSYIWKYALVTSKLKSNPGPEWPGILEKAFVAPVLRKALIDFPFNLNKSSIEF